MPYNRERQLEYNKRWRDNPENRQKYNAYARSRYQKDGVKANKRKIAELTPAYVNQMVKRTGRTAAEAKRDILKYRIKQIIKIIDHAK